MKKLKQILLIGLLSIGLTLQVASADDGTYPSNYSPSSRDTVNYVQGVQGFDYPSFNNFLDNPNILGVGGDERKFTTGKYCPGGVCPVPSDCPEDDLAPCSYSDTVAGVLEEGDKVRFEVYFHNNGNDPYDGEEGTSPNARNVEVGIDLSDQSPDSSEPSLLIRPDGYIYADNNEYRTDKNDSTTIIRDGDGNVIRTTTDDIQIFLSNNNLELVPSDFMGLAMRKVNEEGNDWNPDVDNDGDYWEWGFFETWPSGNTTSQSTTFTDPNTNTTTTITATPNYDEENNKMWLEFDEIPGCFRYSGFAYFDAVVVEKPQEEDVCVDLLVNHPTTVFEDRISEFQAKALDQDGNTFNGKITYSVEAGHGFFYTSKPTGTENTEGLPMVEEFNPLDPLPTSPLGGWCGPETSNTGGLDLDFDPGIIIEDGPFGGFDPAGPVSTKTAVPGSVIESFDAKDVIKMNTDLLKGIKWDPNREASIYTSPRRLALTLDPVVIVDAIDFIDPLGGQLSITVEPGQKVYFRATNPGEQVITVDTECTENRLCTRYFDVEALPRFCQDLLVNHPEPILENRLATFSAVAIDQEGETFEGKITYSVIAGHGRIYLTKPPLPEDADAVQIQEYDPDTTDTDIPEDDLCEDPVFDLPTPNVTRVPGIITLDDAVIEDQIDIDLTSPNKTPYTYGKIEIDGISASDANKNSDQPKPGLALPDIEPQKTINIAVGIATNAEKTVSDYHSDIVQVPDWLLKGKLIEESEFKLPNEPVIEREARANTVAKQLQALSLIDLELQPTITENYVNPYLIGAAVDPNFIAESPALEGLISLLSLADDLDETLFPSYQSVTVNPGDEVYIWAEEAGEAVISVDTNCTVNEECTRFFDITPVERICENLEIECTPTNPETGDDVTCNVVNVFDSEGDPIAGDVEVNWTTTTGCTFPSGTDNFTSTIADSVTCTGTQTAGNIFATLSPESEFYDPVCADEIIIDDLVCVDLNMEIREFGEADTVASLDGEIIYQVSADAEFSSVHSENIIFEIDPAVGAFVDISTADEFAALVTQIVMPDPFEMADLETAIDPALISQTVTVAEETTVTFVTFANGGSVANGLTARVENYEDVEDCTAEIPYNSEAICEYIELQENDNGCVDIVGDFSNHPGEIIVTTNEGGISLTEDGPFEETITIAADEVASSGNLIPLYCEETEGAQIDVEAVDSPSPLCEDSFVFEEEICVDLSIVTPDEPWDTSNDDDQTFEIEVETNPDSFLEELEFVWEVSGADAEWLENDNDDELDGDDLVTQDLNAELEFEEGETPEVTVYARHKETEQRYDACEDSIEAEAEGDEPEIEKFVYPEASFIDADANIINIAERLVTRFVTYMVVVNVDGIDEENGQELEINDEKIGPGGYIAAVDPTQSGRLIFEDMAIYIIRDGGQSDNEREIIFLSEDYHEDLLNPAGPYADYHDDEFEFDNDSVGNLLNDSGKFDDGYHEDLYDEFACESDDVNEDEDFCLEDYEEALETFGTGERLTFRNVDELGDNGQIIIKYEMDNYSNIDAGYCETLTAASGCGEAFLNIARYDTNEDYSDFDDAEVIVVCPYILTREGGDVFFHDVLDIGADAAYCGEFKTSDGPGIKPSPLPGKEIVSTGEGESINEGNLTVDTHSVCNSQNVEEYNLENFSSTICEIESAEVAETWKETYINQAIEANLFRIARWGATNNGVKQLNNESDFGNNNNNGVFVAIGEEITIGSNGTYTIGSQTGAGIPAAQTYIIQGKDLVIESDIVYEANPDYSNPNNVPSAAFIVIDGDIRIGSNVQNLDGIFMAIDTDQSGDGKVGPINPGEKSNLQLTINGSLIGNVYELFASRIKIGNAAKDQGSVVIHYQENLLLNTPPGIGELIEVDYALIPN